MLLQIKRFKGESDEGPEETKKIFEQYQGNKKMAFRTKAQRQSLQKNIYS